MVAFADDLSRSGRLLKLCSWWKKLLDVCPKYGYFPKQSKIILIVKPKYKSKAVEIFNNTNIKTSSVQRHLVAIIGSELYRKEYSQELVSKWRDDLLLLSKNAKTQTQTAYSPNLHGFQSKWNFFNCFIPTWQNHMKSIEVF